MRFPRDGQEAKEFAWFSLSQSLRQPSEIDALTPTEQMTDLKVREMQAFAQDHELDGGRGRM